MNIAVMVQRVENIRFSWANNFLFLKSIKNHELKLVLFIKIYLPNETL